MTPDRSSSEALLGDVVAFTALPAVWVGQAPAEVARALCVALDRTLFPRAIAVLMRTEQGIVEVRAGEAARLDAEIVAWRAGQPFQGPALHVGIGPLGARGVILLHADEVPRDRLLLASLAANLADTALREAALDQQAATAREQITRMEKLSALGQLVSGVAHELRTPLTYANNSLYLLQRHLAKLPGLTPEDRAAFEPLVAEVIAAHERIARTVGTLRHLSGARKPAWQQVDLSEAVGEATRLFALTHVGLVSIDRQLEGRGLVQADRVELQQVVLNLLQNAAEARSDGIRIAVRTLDEGPTVALVVEDNGPGIPPDARGRMFDPFFTTKPHGMGLGLSIVRRIAEAHGATITVAESALGGARFELRFPRLTQVPVQGDESAPLSASSGR